MKRTARRRRSSTPNHSFVPSVATAAVDERMAGMNPAAAATTPFLSSGVCMAMESGATADLTPNAKEQTREKVNE